MRCTRHTRGGGVDRGRCARCTRHTRDGFWVDRGGCVGRRGLLAPGEDKNRSVVPEADRMDKIDSR